MVVLDAIGLNRSQFSTPCGHFLRRMGRLGLIGLIVSLGCRTERDVASTEATQAEVFRPSAKVIAKHNHAVALMGQFDYAAAYTILDDLVAAHPSWTDLKVDLAISALNRRQEGDFQRAVSLLNQVRASNPSDLRALYCLGILSLDGGDPEAALQLFGSVAERDPSDAYAVYYTGQCEFQLGQVDAALGRYEVAMQRDPYLRSTYYGAFQACLRLGKPARAEEYRKDFERLEGNPQARLAEIKYTRMGPKAELRVLNVDSVDRPAKPPGQLFAAAAALVDSEGREIPWTISGAERVNLTAVDFENDGQLLLFLAGASRDPQRPNVLLQQESEGFRWLPEHPLAACPDVRAVVWGDYDNDGLVDVYLCRRGPNQLWRQTAKGQWRDVTDATGTSGGDVDTLDGQMFDADHDGDLDLFLCNDGPNELFNNNLNGSFRPLAAEQGLGGRGARSISSVAFDADHDRDLDLLVVNAEPPHELYVNDRLWAYRPAESASELLSQEIRAAVAVDRDADGQVELMVAGRGQIQVWRPDATRTWTAEPLDLAPSSTGKTEFATRDFGSQLSVADVDGDGQLELAISQADGICVVDTLTGAVQQRLTETPSCWRLVNLTADTGPSMLSYGIDGPQLALPGPGRFKFLRVSLTGKEDQADQMRSNRSGIGVDAAARLGARWTAFRTLRSDSGVGQCLQPVALGLAGRSGIDFVRLTWPDGVFQTESGLTPGTFHRIAETQRQVASCPVVFAWNGQRFEFITDVLGGGGLGFNLSNGQYGEPRPWENLLLPGDALQPRAGRYQIKLGEPMEEVCYLDAARLRAYDLPPGWKMTLDERFAVQGPAPTGQPVFYQELVEPVRAVNQQGDSVLRAIQRADFLAAEPGPRDARFIGRTAEHVVELTFAERLDRGQPYLLFDGWIEYPYSQTMFAAWQAGASFDAPTIEACDAAGGWQTILPQFGYMAGMPRQAVVPLPIDLLPPGTRQLRITTNQEIYWDRFAVVFAQSPPSVTRQEFRLQSASAAEVGFARRTDFPQRRASYDYADRSPLWDTRYLSGCYSEFGSVTELVAEIDDAVAVIGPGEEIHLEFAASGELPASGTRYYVLELNGWCKDMDLYTLDGETVAPLPTRPDGRPVPEQERRLRLHSENHRRLRGGF